MGLFGNIKVKNNMSSIIDRRRNPPNKSGGNRQRFIKRVEGKIKKALPDVIDKNNIKGMTSKDGKIRVPIRGIKEPTFSHDRKTGDKGYVRPGNDQFQQGDKVKKPKGGGGKGSGRGADMNAEDFEEDFIVELTKDEFLHYFFQDLELPEMIKKFLESVSDYKLKRSGFTTVGIPARLNKQQSLKKSLARKISMRSTLEKKLKKLEEKLANANDDDQKKLLRGKISKVEKKLKSIPFIDEIDLRYNNFVKEPIPTTSAVMFCLMDVSASMGMVEKDIAKRFFTLLYLFLGKEYENIDLVFIRHTTTAKEVTEEEFFTGRETGGTRVASALELMKDIIKERYSNGKWNIYGCQASDGDIWEGEDDVQCQSLMHQILPLCQYYAYIEIDRRGFYGEGFGGGLSAAYEPLTHQYKNFVSRSIEEVNEIWPVFKGLFEKKEKES